MPDVRIGLHLRPASLLPTPYSPFPYDSDYAELSAGPKNRHISRLRDPRFCLICLGVLAPAFVGTAIFFHQVYLTELRGWPLELFASAFVVMSATAAAFALLGGWLIHRFSAARLLPLSRSLARRHE